MQRLRYLAIAAALAIGVTQSPVAASAHAGGGRGGDHFAGGHGFAGVRFGDTHFPGGHFDRRFGRFRGRAIFGVGGIFLGYDFRYGLGYGYPGYYPPWYCSQYPYGYNPAVGCYYPYPGPGY
jgi:hypothetical protein